MFVCVCVCVWEGVRCSAEIYFMCVQVDRRHVRHLSFIFFRSFALFPFRKFGFSRGLFSFCFNPRSADIYFAISFDFSYSLDLCVCVGGRVVKCGWLNVGGRLFLRLFSCVSSFWTLDRQSDFWSVAIFVSLCGFGNHFQLNRISLCLFFFSSLHPSSFSSAFVTW